MKITLSKSQWEFIGEQAGWINTEAKKKDYKHSPKSHGFVEECIKKNKDKDSPGGYCASIVDRAKGTTDWRKGPRK